MMKTFDPIRSLATLAVLAAASATAQTGPVARSYTYWGRPSYVMASNVLNANVRSVQTNLTHLRVASYNIENFTDAISDGPERTEEQFATQARGAAAILDGIEADIVLIIEIEGANSLRKLNDSLKKPYPFGWITDLGSGDGGKHEQKLNLALLSRVELDEIREVDFAELSGPGRPTRGLIRFQKNLGDGHRLLGYGVHLKSNWGVKERNIAQRRHALQILTNDIAWVQSKQKAAFWEMVVLGDTNVDPALLPQFEGDTSFEPLAGWRDLWADVPASNRVTCDTRRGDEKLEFPPATFDRVFVSSDLTSAPWRAGSVAAIMAGTCTTNSHMPPGEGGHVSDHYPVYVDLMK
jgi:endonuclease/exonuclease/phosphatase family metal-dependent hydrolase